MADMLTITLLTIPPLTVVGPNHKRHKQTHRRDQICHIIFYHKDILNYNKAGLRFIFRYLIIQFYRKCI